MVRPGCAALALRPFLRRKANDDQTHDKNRQTNQCGGIDAVHVESPFLSRIPPTAAMTLIPELKAVRPDGSGDDLQLADPEVEIPPNDVESKKQLTRRRRHVEI